jgi:hypothetical protein
MEGRRASFDDMACNGSKLTVYSIYPAALFAFHAGYVLLESVQYAGYVAGVAMVLIFCTANGQVRKRQYEFFYIAHIILVAIILVTGKYETQTNDVGKR